MAKVYKPGFIYMKSKILKQEVAMNEETNRVYCEDKVEYSPQEILLFYEAGMKVDVGAHLVKKVFEGEVVKIGRTMGTNGQAKPNESGGGASSVDGKNTAQEIQGTNAISAGSTSGELDIY
jgi:hypothetical protein